MIKQARTSLFLALSAAAGVSCQTTPEPEQDPYYGGGYGQDGDYVQVTPTGQGGEPYGGYGQQSGGGYPPQSYDQQSYGTQGQGSYGQQQQPQTYQPPATGGGQAWSNPPAQSGRTYTVQKGDTLFRISRNHGTSVDAIMSANGLSDTKIYPGQSLTIP